MQTKKEKQDFTIGDDETYFEKAPRAKSALAERSVTYHELLDNTQKGFESGNRLENGCEAYGNQQKMMAYTREMLHLAKKHLKYQELLVFDVDTEFNRKESERLIQRLEQQSIPSLFHKLYLMKKKRTAEINPAWRNCSAIKLNKISLAYTEKEALELADFLESCQDHEDMPPLETIYGPCYIQAVIHLCERLCSVLLQILALPAFPNEKRRVNLFYMHLEEYKVRMAKELDHYQREFLKSVAPKQIISKNKKYELLEKIYNKIKSEQLRKIVREYGFSNPSSLLKEMQQCGCKDLDLEQVFKVLTYENLLNELTTTDYVQKGTGVITPEGIAGALVKTLPLITKPGDYYMVLKVIGEILSIEPKHVRKLMNILQEAIDKHDIELKHSLIESSIRDMGTNFKNVNHNLGDYRLPDGMNPLEFNRLWNIAREFEANL